MIISFLEENKRKRRRKKVLIISSICLFLLVLGSAAGLLFRTYEFTHKVFKSNGLRSDIASLLPVSANSATYSSEIDKAIKTNTSINLLLLGYGGGSHDGGYLTDSMMVITIDPSQKNVAMLSIPRDLWVSVPTSVTAGTFSKINAAYEIGQDTVNYQNRDSLYKGQYGGGNMAKKVVGDVFGVPINYFVAIDFDGFMKVIDSLGGIDVNVENSFDDYYYPSGDNTTTGPDCIAPMNTKTTCRYWHVHFSAGLQHMDSQLALEYTRSRHAEGVEGSDFARAKRQQNVMEAIKQKALQIGALSQVLSIMDSLQNNIQTDLTLADTKDLITLVKDWKIATPIHGSLETANLVTTGVASDGEDIVEPTLGIGKYSQIQSFFKNIWTEGPLVAELQTAKVTIVDSTHTPASLTSAVNALQTDLIPATKGLPQGTTPLPTTTIYDTSNGKYPTLVKQIEQVLGTSTVVMTPYGTSPADGSVAIVLGADYQPTPAAVTATQTPQVDQEVNH